MEIFQDLLVLLKGFSSRYELPCVLLMTYGADDMVDESESALSQLSYFLQRYLCIIAEVSVGRVSFEIKCFLVVDKMLQLEESESC